jgi:hypothetical protein
MEHAVSGSSQHQTLALDAIRIDGGTQPRVRIDEETVAAYAERLDALDEFPPLVVFFDGADHWLADGFHRWHAHRKAGLTTAEVTVRAGSRRDAVLFSVGANDTHGLRRTTADKQRAIETLLQDPEWAAWSDNAIAKACAVDHKTVAARRMALVGNSQDAAVVQRLATTVSGAKPRMAERGGKTYTVETAAIGPTPSPPTLQPIAAVAAPQPQPEPKLGLQPAAAEPEAEVTADMQRDAIEQMARDLESALADNKVMGEIFDAEDRLAEAVRQVKQLTAENAGLRQRLYSLQNESNEQIKLVNSLRRQIKKLESK